MKVHLEPIYGFYHGQDPRTFEPDEECCSEKEIEAHKAACESANRGQWGGDDSGCRVHRNAIVCKSSFGLGVYHVVMSEDGDFLRDATYKDIQHEGEWDENCGNTVDTATVEEEQA